MGSLGWVGWLPGTPECVEGGVRLVGGLWAPLSPTWPQEGDLTYNVLLYVVLPGPSLKRELLPGGIKCALSPTHPINTPIPLLPDCCW